MFNVVLGLHTVIMFPPERVSTAHRGGNDTSAVGTFPRNMEHEETIVCKGQHVNRALTFSKSVVITTHHVF